MSEFRVLKCFSCSTFQVQMMNKSGKFACKLCGQKQSVMKEYFRSFSGKDCRNYVQDLNSQRGELKEREISRIRNVMSEEEQYSPPREAENYATSPIPKRNRWEIFMEAASADAAAIALEEKQQGRQSFAESERILTTADSEIDDEQVVVPVKPKFSFKKPLNNSSSKSIPAAAEKVAATSAAPSSSTSSLNPFIECTQEILDDNFFDLDF